MNWARIYSGSACAALIFYAIEIGLPWFLSGAYGIARLIFSLFVWWGVGFIASLTYALARPRLGPGPKTAFLIGVQLWFLVFTPRMLFTFGHLPIQVVVLTGWLSLVACCGATYVAGWQYIEKAP